MEQGAVSRLCAEASAQRVEGVPSPHRDPVSLGHKEACPRSDLRTRTAAEEELGAGGGGRLYLPGTICWDLRPRPLLFSVTLTGLMAICNYFAFFYQRAS